jgi:hypothetical protein
MPKVPNGRKPAKDLLGEARKTVAAHSKRWSDFRNTGGVIVDDYFDDGFTYIERVLDDKSEPKDWVKDGLAILIGYCGAGRKLYKATYDLLASED